jgi:hypothetical protein
MNTDDQAVQPIAQRFARLTLDGHRLMVDVSALDRMLMMPVPASRVDWLSAAAGRLWRDRTRCMAALLLLEPLSGRWTIRFPRQRCGQAGVSWTVTAEDFTGLDPSWVLSGTFQSSSRSDGSDELVPATDGLHFVLVHGETDTQLRGFICAGGVLRPAGEQPVMINDWAATLDAAMPRLDLA